MFGLHIVDALVLIVYLIGITILGAAGVRMVRNMSDYFMPRKFGKAMLSMHGFGTGTHSDQAVYVASGTYVGGLSGIWFQWVWLFVSPFYWLIAPLMRRFRAITTADVFEARYGRSMAMLYSIIGILFMIAAIGGMLKGSSAVVSAAMGERVNPNTVMLVMTGLFVIYGVVGGLSGAIITDFVQGILTIVFSFMLLPPLFSAVGGLSGMHEKLTDPKWFSLTVPGQIGFFYVAVAAVNSLIGIVAQPHIMGNCAAGRTEMDGRVGLTVGNFLKRFCTVAWALTGLAAIAYYGIRDVKPDAVYGLVAEEFLPVGLLGLFLAALLSTLMSSCDSFMIASSALFTENIYKRVAPNRSDRHYLWVGRVVAVVVVAVAVWYALGLKDVLEALKNLWKVAPLAGIAFWLGLFWRRATTAGAVAATLAACAVLWLTTTGFFIEWVGTFPQVAGLPWTVMEAEGRPLDAPVIYFPWQLLMFLAPGIIVGIVVSLLTPRENPEKLDRFYELVRTPVNKAEDSPPVPCTLPAGVRPAPRRVLAPWRNFDIPVPSALTVWGFVACWAAVAAIIGGFYLLVNL